MNIKAIASLICIFSGTIIGTIAAAGITKFENYQGEKKLWAIFFIAIIILISGIILKRQGIKEQALLNTQEGYGIKDTRRYLSCIIEKLKILEEEKENLELETIHQRLDEISSNDIYDFIESRYSIIDNYGLSGYASIMGEFAIAERYLNRCWSASGDGHKEETLKYLSLCLPQFETVEKYLQTIKPLWKNKERRL